MQGMKARRLWCCCLVVVLVVGLAGCAPHSAGSNLLPPGMDNPRDYEEIEVSTAKNTATALTPDSHTLYSRPLNWRSTGVAETTWTAWCTVDPSIGTLQTGRAHSSEYHAGWAYFMTTPSYEGGTFKPTPLYACDATGKVTKIIDPAAVPAVAMYDFSVAPDGRYVMLYDEDKNGYGILAIHLWSVEQEKLVATFYATADEAPQETAKKELTTDHATWDIPYGNDSWHEVAAASESAAHYEYTAVAVGNDLPNDVQSCAVIQFDDMAAKDATITRYPVPANVSIAMVDLQMIDPATGMIAYDDYPMFIEYGDSLFNFDRAQIPTHLFLYDIKTGTRTCIDELPACRFLASWTGSDTLTYNVASDPKIRTATPAPHDPRTYVTRGHASLLTRADCLPIVYSTTAPDGASEAYHYAVLDLTTMKIFKDDGVIATPKATGAFNGQLFFPRTSPWHLVSEAEEGMPAFASSLTTAAGTTVQVNSFRVGNKLRSGNGPFTPSQTLLDAITDISGAITDPSILCVIECTAPSSLEVGIQCAIDKVEGSSQGKPWFYPRYVFLFHGATDCQIEFKLNQKTVTTLCKNPKAAGAPLVVADTLTGVNNLFVPIAMKFPTHETWSGSLLPGSSLTPSGTHDPTVISEETITFPSGEKYVLQLKQTEYMKPLTPSDPGFDIYEGAYLGRFSFVTRNMDGTFIDELGINQYFGNGTFGLIGAFVPATGDYNKDGDIDFDIGTSVGDDSGEMKYALFSISKAGKLRHINARGYKEDGYIYTTADGQTWGFWQEDPHSKSIKVTVGGSEIQHDYVAGEYVWTNGEYVFKK